MVTHFIALITAAVLMGNEAPIIVSPAGTQTACLIEATKLNSEHIIDLNKKGARFACLSLVQPSV